MRLRLLSTTMLVLTNLLWTAAMASGGVIYESGTLGETGVTREELDGDSTPASNIALFSYVGVRFEVSHESTTSRIGGHFLGGFSETSFFGAIVTLADDEDFPNSGDLSTSDVLGVTVMNFFPASAEIAGDLAVRLEPGWYAVVFGTSQFGATGRGAALRNGHDIGSPSYLMWQWGTGWFDFSQISYLAGPGNFRFFVEGTVIPEPTTGSLLAIAMLSLNGFVRKFSRNHLRATTQALATEWTGFEVANKCE